VVRHRVCPGHEPKEGKKRTDEDYRQLDDAIATVSKWQPEITDALAKRGISWKALSDVLDAMRAVHDGEQG
jgi:oligoribonuclease (3'-5' exoribonuclease)